ncbi:MAG: DUF2974 domain-containing protein [Oscillospiraceae bacterium]|nr:DUF2974 domain-containing protein [Oscillospiraceae bacterium]
MLSIFQIERLCNIVYLDILISGMNQNNLLKIMEFMLKEGFDKEKEFPCKMTRAEWEQVARSIITDSALGELFIIKHVNNEKTGHRAFCFSKEGGEVYVVFRGTNSDEEWFDNAIGLLGTETPAQKAALDFVKEVAGSIKNLKHLCVAGHSKGGNKAQYCLVAGNELIDSCVSVDGQGFSRLFFEKYSDIIEKSKEKLTAIAERRDFVNCLGFYLQKPAYYTGGRGEKTEESPFGQPLPFFHCPDALRLNTGEAGKTAQISTISEVINSFTVYFLTEKKYERKREKTALGLVSLMTDNIDISRAAESVAEAALVFFELAATDEDFRTDLRNMLIFERDVVTATAQFIRKSINQTENEIADKAMRLLAEKLILKPLYFRYFIKVTERYVVFTNKTEEMKEHHNHVMYFIKTIIKYMEKSKK